MRMVNDCSVHMGWGIETTNFYDAHMNWGMMMVDDGGAHTGWGMRTTNSHLVSACKEDPRGPSMILVKSIM